MLSYQMRCGSLSIGLFVPVLGLLTPVAAWANIGKQWWGAFGSEPRGVKEVAITDEKLTIDLRPVASRRPVEVEAVYLLSNAGAEKTLDLVFISGVPEVTDFEVCLDGRPTMSRLLPIPDDRAALMKPPMNWRFPDRLPGIGRDIAHATFRTGLFPTDSLAFTVELPRGSSTLRARYRAPAAGADEGYPTATWEFPYVLAPARDWDGFGRLDVTVLIPEGWQWTSQPALASDGAVLRGSFDGLPADYLVVAIRKPVGQGLAWVQGISYTLYGVSILIEGLLCWWLGLLGGRWLGRKVATGLWGETRAGGLRWVLAATCAIAWSALILVGWSVTINRIYDYLEGQESPYFHERFTLPSLGIVLASVLILPIGFAITLAGATRSRCQLSRQLSIPKTPSECNSLVGNQPSQRAGGSTAAATKEPP
jgi:hypothetical protein